VVPSLDAATLKTFLRIDRPENEYKSEDYINGLVKFRQ
jgi:wyosine [tRNA(Phe)-imidazoG37] synthetase (radical SAM superfamily)